MTVVVPGGKAVVAIEQVPPASVQVPSVPVGVVRVTVPVGMGPVEAVTVTVQVTEVPASDGFGEQATVVVVGMSPALLVRSHVAGVVVVTAAPDEVVVEAVPDRVQVPTTPSAVTVVVTVPAAPVGSVAGVGVPEGPEVGGTKTTWAPSTGATTEDPGSAQVTVATTGAPKAVVARVVWPEPEVAVITKVPAPHRAAGIEVCCVVVPDDGWSVAEPG